jgi:phenylpropionate dioxygenase-like ring-hydroxylating dioxygenase large terminal subunit
MVRSFAPAGAPDLTACTTCPTSAATARPSCSKAAGNSQTHRLPDPSLDLRSRRPSDRRAGTSSPGRDLELQRTKLENWHGLLFKGPRSANADLAGMKVAPELDFTGYKLDRIELHQCNYNWKTFIEVYLEDYHVRPFHPGLGGFVTCDDLTWQFGDWYSVQRVGVTSLTKPGSATYQRWHKAVLDLYEWRIAQTRRDLADLLPERHG